MSSSSVMSSPKSATDGSSGTLVSRVADTLDVERAPEDSDAEPCEAYDGTRSPDADDAAEEAAVVDADEGTVGSSSDGAAAFEGRRATRVIVVRGFASCGTATDL